MYDKLIAQLWVSKHPLSPNSNGKRVFLCGDINLWTHIFHTKFLAFLVTLFSWIFNRKYKWKAGWCRGGWRVFLRSEKSFWTHLDSQIFREQMAEKRKRKSLKMRFFAIVWKIFLIGDRSGSSYQWTQKTRSASKCDRVIFGDYFFLFDIHCNLCKFSDRRLHTRDRPL